MSGFSSSFLIFFYQIAFGGLFALAGTPFQEIERGFYKSTAGVLYAIALLEFWGRSHFYRIHFIESIQLGHRIGGGFSQRVYHLVFLLHDFVMGGTPTISRAQLWDIRSNRPRMFILDDPQLL